MHAVILAGGFGTRLRSVVSDVPKPLAPIGDKPFLAWMIELLAASDFTSVTLSVYHDWQKIQGFFASRPPVIPVDYAIEETPLGTGGAIAYALSHYKGRDPVIVLNGDSFIKVNYRDLYKHHLKNGAPLTMTLRHVEDSGRYGRIIEKEGVITSFAAGETGKDGYINAGVYVMRPDLFTGQNMPAAFSFEQDFLPLRVAELKPTAFHGNDYFIDIGIPSDYARACKELPEIFQCLT